MITGLIPGTISFQDMPSPEHIEPASGKMSSLFNLTHILYNLSHSIIIFALVILYVYLIHKFVLKSKRSILVMFGWLMHILIDISTHSYAFYLTPFLWPISNYKFNGISWTNPWFLVTNYIILIIVYYILYKRKVY